MTEPLFAAPTDLGERVVLVAVQVPGCAEAHAAIPIDEAFLGAVHAAMDGEGPPETLWELGRLVGVALPDLWLAQGRGVGA